MSRKKPKPEDDLDALLSAPDHPIDTATELKNAGDAVVTARIRLDAAKANRVATRSKKGDAVMKWLKLTNADRPRDAADLMRQNSAREAAHTLAVKRGEIAEPVAAPKVYQSHLDAHLAQGRSASANLGFGRKHSGRLRKA